MEVLLALHSVLLNICNVPVKNFIFLFPDKNFETGDIRTSVLKMEAAGDFPQFAELIVYGIYVGLGLCLLRFFLNDFILKPLGRFAMKQRKIKCTPVKALDDAFAVEKIIPAEKMPGLCKETNMSEKEVKGYIKQRRIERLQNLRLYKFTESWWRFLLYSATTAAGIYVNYDKPWVEDIGQYWVGYPLQVVPQDIKMYYLLEFGLYLNFFIFQFLDTKRKDFWEMFIHHIATLLLIAFSYMTNFVRIGSMVLLLHDVSDIFLESAKILNYTKQARPIFSIPADATFVAFAVVFFVSRLVLFPKRILYANLVDVLNYFEMHPTYYIWAALLLCLQFLHVFWFYLICRLIKKFVVDGIEKDERSVTESDISEDEGDEKPKGE
eukprot:CAMPEP_0117756294 /NCGR_PEP_ID=MMETSP0947-20121206/13987_1 /TAXON_ID=44440 /ORGANISM="Chattonella subsalsa, Strain CCMP2191" /LENGTH=379 /DNA_ID=CAMNT_0005575843 /DNA_START=151 /DNA_END=1290 /DNA_ORIENTATION=+